MTSAVVGPAPASGAAAASDAGDAGPSFNESAGCGVGVAGPQRPKVSAPGFVAAGEVVAGPWGDFFGRNRAQIEASLVDWAVPGGGGRTVRVHQRALPAFRQVTAALADHAAAGRFYPAASGAAFVYRTVGGRRDLSNHAFGNAIDINPARNPYSGDNVLITDMPAWYVAAWQDAGFCWGGDWVYVKDAMHFSWMGPAATGGYGPLPPPYPPLTPASPFTRRAFAGPAAWAADAAAVAVAVAVADRSGDGAGDVYVVAPRDGGLRLVAAGARSGFAVVGYREDLAATAPRALLGDWDRTGRADLWLATPAGPRLELTVYTDADDFDTPRARYAVPVSVDDATELALADYDRDLALDLYVMRRGATTHVEVWTGASGYTRRVVGTPTGLGDTSDPTRWGFLVADHDVDGRPDLYAVEKADPARVRVQVHAGAGYAGPATHLTTGIAAGPGTAFAVGDYDGDGRPDVYALRNGQLAVYLGGVPGPGVDLTAWFMPDEEPLPWDAGPECLGPGACDQIGFADAAARWFVKDEISSESEDVDYLFGNPGDVPFVGDWDCDGVETPGLYRRRDGFVYLRNSNTTGVADVSFFFGNPSDLPLAGDFDGDGCDTVSLYRPSEATVYVINELGSRSTGLGGAEYRFMFGNPGDKPFVGDVDGDGIDEVGLHRETTGLVYYRYTLTSGTADEQFIYGDPGDRLVAGDWDGDGTDTVAVYRPAEGNWYVKLDNRPGFADHAIHYHAHADDGTTHPFAGRLATSSDR